MRRRSLLMMVVALISLHVPGVVAQTAGPLTVISSKRAKAYSSPNREIRARDEAADVVLVLRVGGLSRDDFRMIAQDAIYVMAGDEKLPPSIVATAVIDGKAQLLIVLVGPKATLDMTLFLGAYPRVAFKAETVIAESLQ
jgi:hypothetical protein